MPDYAPNYTARYKLTYIAAGVVHDMTLRFARGSVRSTVVTLGNEVADDLFDALHLNMPTDVAAIGVETMMDDETYWTPSATIPTLTAGAHPPSTYSPVQKIISLTFPGKGGSSKARVVIYGYFVEQDLTTGWALDMKILPAEDPRVAAAIDVLQAAASLKAINNVNAVWYERATVKPNDFLLRLVRRGIIS